MTMRVWSGECLASVVVACTLSTVMFFPMAASAVGPHEMAGGWNDIGEIGYTHGFVVEYESHSATTWLLNVNSTPILGVSIQGEPGGTTNYSAPVIGQSTVTLAAPISLVSGGMTYAFQKWTLNDIAQTTGQRTLSFAITADSAAVAEYAVAKVWATGGNDYGQLGLGDNVDRNVFVPVPGLASVRAVSPGTRFSLALLSDGTVWATGQNYPGQLGLGDTADRNIFERVGALDNIVAISGGYLHSLALRNDGTVWATGFNRYGQLGLGHTTDRNSFTQVPDLSGVIAVSAGWSHSLALKDDGTVWAAGYNLYGQLGLGDNSNRTRFVQVANLSGIVAIAAGEHSLALKNDGAVWATGYNSAGELGLGDTSDRNTFMAVPGLSGIIAVSAECDHSLALKNDGTVWAAGRNDTWQLGLGDNTHRDVFTVVPSLSSIVDVSAGTWHSLALRNDGALCGTGNNRQGELGLGDNTQHTVFTPVPGLSEIAAAATGRGHSAGGGHSLALQGVSLSVQSTPIQGVAITGTNPGATNYSVYVVEGSAVTLAAPEELEGVYRFIRWTLNGEDFSYTSAVSFNIAADTAVVAVYEWCPRVMVNSTPISGIPVGGNPAGTTNYWHWAYLLDPDEDPVVMHVPETHSAGGQVYRFIRWVKNGTPWLEGDRYIALYPMDLRQDTNLVAEYALQRTLAVASIPVASANIAGDFPGTTNYSVMVDDGAAISLTAPGVVECGGEAYAFLRWLVNETPRPAGETTAAFVMNEDKEAVAEYTLQCTVSGAGIVEETYGRATLFVDISRDCGGMLARDALRLARLRPRQLIISAGISSLTVANGMAVIEGACSFNGLEGYRYIATIADDSPDSCSMHVTRISDGATMLDVTGPISQGDFRVATP